MYKISICTVCMNRLGHVRETLPVNIVANSSYPDIEFVLLDYNSGDGLEEWVKSHMMEYIDNGTLKYYKNYVPAYFDLSHSKNMAARLATGDIICMLDGDNYAGTDYAYWINSVFAQYGKNTIVTTIRPDYIPFQDQGGKMAVHRDLFNAVRGFDEMFRGYGMEDVDLTSRLEAEGGVRVYIEDHEYLQCITHTQGDRIANGYFMKNLAGVLVLASPANYRLPIPQLVESNAQQNVLYFFRDGTYLEAVFEMDPGQAESLLTYGGWILSRQECAKGSYQFEQGGLWLTPDGASTAFYREEEPNVFFSAAAGPNSIWRKVSDQETDVLANLVIAFSECKNRFRYGMNLQNVHLGSGHINPQGWSKGTVYHNFDTQTPIHCDG